MDIDRIHFYVDDAGKWRDWFACRMDFHTAGTDVTPDTYTEHVRSGAVRFSLSSPLTPTSPVAAYLRCHPPGVADVALHTRDLDATFAALATKPVTVLQPPTQTPQGRWAKIAGWGSLVHTLVEYPGAMSGGVVEEKGFQAIDHVVLNVAAGDLENAAAWYEQVLGFQRQQSFHIYTNQSGLRSVVLVHPQGTIQLPINEPTSVTSQIQEFLDANRGSGVQHVALATQGIIDRVTDLRQRGLPFLQVPKTYYEHLQERSPRLSPAELHQIAAQQILVDWQTDNPDALLLQIFTQPIFAEPTFFFELMERRDRARGFGEGNFRALFEAIEREQQKRGNLR